MGKASSSTSAGGVAERAQPQTPPPSAGNQSEDRRKLMKIPFVGRSVILHRTRAHGSGETSAIVFNVHDEAERRVDLSAIGSDGLPYAVFGVNYGTGPDNWEYNTQLDLAMWGPEAIGETMGETAAAASALGYRGNTA